MSLLSTIIFDKISRMLRLHCKEDLSRAEDQAMDNAATTYTSEELKDYVTNLLRQRQLLSLTVSTLVLHELLFYRRVDATFQFGFDGRIAQAVLPFTSPHGVGFAIPEELKVIAETEFSDVRIYEDAIALEAISVFAAQGDPRIIQIVIPTTREYASAMTKLEKFVLSTYRLCEHAEMLIQPFQLIDVKVESGSLFNKVRHSTVFPSSVYGSSFSSLAEQNIHIHHDPHQYVKTANWMLSQDEVNRSHEIVSAIVCAVPPSIRQKYAN